MLKQNYIAKTINWLKASPGIFVSPDDVSVPDQQIRVFVEMLPRGVSDIVGEPIQTGSMVRHSFDYISGFESLYDAAIMLESAAFRLSHYVIPENCFFFFSESTQALLHLLDPFSTDGQMIDFGQDSKGNRYKENKSDPMALFLCKLKQVNALEDFVRKHNQHSTDNSCCVYQMDWFELKKLKQSIY